MKVIWQNNPSELAGIHRKLFGWFVLLSFVLCGQVHSVWADNIEAALYKHSAKIMSKVRERGFRSLGVLNFRLVKDGQAPSFTGGLICKNMPIRLENSFTDHMDLEKPMLIVQDASTVAASQIKNAHYRTAEARKLLFQIRYPVKFKLDAQTPTEIVPDVLLCGGVILSSNLLQTRIIIELIDPKNGYRLETFYEFQIPTDRYILADCGKGYSLSSLDRPLVRLSTGAASRGRRGHEDIAILTAGLMDHVLESNPAQQSTKVEPVVVQLPKPKAAELVNELQEPGTFFIDRGPLQDFPGDKPINVVPIQTVGQAEPLTSSTQVADKPDPLTHFYENLVQGSQSLGNAIIFPDTSLIEMQSLNLSGTATSASTTNESATVSANSVKQPADLATNLEVTVEQYDRSIFVGRYPVEWKILYNGVPQTLLDDPNDSSPHSFILRDPQVGERVSFRVKNVVQHPIGLVLTVNGISTLGREVGQTDQMRKWVLLPGQEYEIKGIHEADLKTVTPILGLSAAESLSRWQDLGGDLQAGKIQLSLFQPTGTLDDVSQQPTGTRSRRSYRRFTPPTATVTGTATGTTATSRTIPTLDQLQSRIWQSSQAAPSSRGLMAAAVDQQEQEVLTQRQMDFGSQTDCIIITYFQP